MKLIKVLAIVTALSSTSFFVNTASAQRERRGLPPELKEQLTAEQISELEKAGSMGEAKKLLESWGISMPERRHKGPPRGLPEEVLEQLTDEQKAELEATSDFKAKMDLLKSYGVDMPKPPKRRAEKTYSIE